MESTILDLTLATTHHRHSPSPLEEYQSSQSTYEDVGDETLNKKCRNKTKTAETKRFQTGTCDDVIDPGSPAGLSKDENTCPVDLSLSRALNSPTIHTSDSNSVTTNQNDTILGKISKQLQLEDAETQDDEGYLGDYPGTRSRPSSPSYNTERESGADRGANVITSNISTGSSSIISPTSLYSGPASAAMLPSLIDRFLLAAAAVQGKSAAPVAPPKKFKCQKCHAAFKCKETLDGHNQSYCPMRKPPITPVTSSQTTSGSMNVGAASILSGSGVNNKNHVRELSSLVAQQTSPGEDLLEKVHQQLSNLENVVMASKGFETQHRLGILPSRPVANIRKHKCSACGVMFSRLDTLQIHKEKYCSHKTTNSDDTLTAGNSESLLGNNNRNISSKDTSGDKKPLSASVPLTPPVTATSSAPLPALAGLLECAVAAASSASVANPLRPASPQTIQRVLAGRKRRSPNTENDQDFKPYAKFQCRSCHVKFIHETTLKAHEQSYCTVRQTVANYESQSPPLQNSRNTSTKVESSGVDCGSNQSSSPEPITVEDSWTNRKVASISPPSNSPGAPTISQHKKSNNISSLCKMCDAFLLEGTFNQHLKIYHRISNPQTLSAILNASSTFSEVSNTSNSPPCGCSKNSLQAQRIRTPSNDSSHCENSVGNGHGNHIKEENLENGDEIGTRNDRKGVDLDREADSPSFGSKTTKEFALEREHVD